MPSKQVLRAVYLEKRRFLSEEEYIRRNELLLQNLFQTIDILKFRYLHTFLSMPKYREVDTWSILKWAREANPKIETLTSETLPKGELKHLIIKTDTEFQNNSWGIPHPGDAEEFTSLVELDLVLVPLIAFDKYGHRIGYGKGYYDRFLKKVPNALKVGVALGPPLDKIEFSEDNDVPLDRCVTPFEVYDFV